MNDSIVSIFKRGFKMGFKMGGKMGLKMDLKRRFQTSVKVAAFAAMLVPAVQARAALGDVLDASELKEAKAVDVIDENTKATAQIRVVDMAVGKVKAHQFASSSGQVYGVAWTGKADQELPELLGGYYKEYQSYAGAHPSHGGRVPYRKIDNGKIVVEVWNVTRFVRGKAYVPALLPSGVAATSINSGPIKRK